MWGTLRGNPNATGRLGVVNFARLFAMDADGANMRMISKQEDYRSRGTTFGSGQILDELPQENGAILMARYHQANDQIGSLIGSSVAGLAVDRVDTRTLKSGNVVRPEPRASRFLTDGHGEVRMKAIEQVKGDGYLTGERLWMARPAGGREWFRFDSWNGAGEGFYPLAIDRAADEVFGLRKVDGRLALFARRLAPGGAERLILKRDDVDIDDVITLGRQRRIVGATFITDRVNHVYFDEGLKRLAASLQRALPGRRIEFVEESADGNRLLGWGGSDTDPGTWYLHDRASKQLTPLFPTRPELAGRTLATVEAITYRAADGTMVPAYLTLPPEGPRKGLPAIVLPHGGPSARDVWGFDWLSQYFAAQGYAVIQPNFRGSAGYGDAWFQDNGFRSWKVAVGDVVDAGRHLVAAGIADPQRLAIVGWSYGGYAALQSAVVGPGLFRAVVAIAPVTDLTLLREEYRTWDIERIMRDFIGSGPHLSEGSPAKNAERIAAPVLLFHGDMDVNVDIAQSKLMAERLKAAGRPHRLVIFDKLDHDLEDSAARARLLSESHRFLEASFTR